MDGVLFDTEEAVAAAYKAAGAVMPEGSFGLSWTEWLVDLVGEEKAREIHAAKNRLYERHLYLINDLPLFSLLISNDTGATVSVATSASYPAASVLFDFYDLAFTDYEGVAGVTGQGKIDYLVSLGQTEGWSRGVYVDDNRALGEHIVAEANKQLVYSGWKFVHYVKGVAPWDHWMKEITC